MPADLEIPPTWKRVSVGDLAKVEYGKAKPKSEGPYPAIGSGGEYARVSDALVDPPAIVVGRKGTAGQVWLIREPCWPSDTTFYLNWTTEVDVEFVHAALVANPISSVQGDVLPSLKRPDLAATSILLPPISEQRAISHVLRTMQRAKEATEQVISAAQELKKSLMRHVFKHGPVPVTQGEPADWPTEALDRLVQEDRPIRYGILKPGPDIETGIPYVKVRDYPKGLVELSSLKRTSIQIANQYKRASLQEGDVLVSIRGTTGRVAVVPKELDGGNITQDTARVSPGDSVDRDYLVQYLRSEEAQNFIASWTRGAAVKGINLRELRQLPVPNPSPTVQRRISDLLGAVDQKIAAEEARREALATLFDSLLNDLMTARLRVADLEVPA